MKQCRTRSNAHFNGIFTFNEIKAARKAVGYE